MIFETDRLLVRKLNKSDSDLFFELMSNPNVMNPIPQNVFTRTESDSKLTELISLEKSSNTKIWSLTEKGNNKLIGSCGFLKNNENDDEIAYRLIERFLQKRIRIRTNKNQHQQRSKLIVPFKIKTKKFTKISLALSSEEL